jgi:hypothetical protein
MIARGDLGVELPFAWVPLLQKAMIYECNRFNTYVITATQMLQSMIEHEKPTRAEVTDIFQAVLGCIRWNKCRYVISGKCNREISARKYHDVKNG